MKHDGLGFMLLEKSRPHYFLKSKCPICGAKRPKPTTKLTPLPLAGRVERKESERK